MIRKVGSYFSLILVELLITGCAMIAEKTKQTTGIGGGSGIITGGVVYLVIKGPSRVNVGETITLKADGYDAKQSIIKRPGAVKPT